MNKLKIPFALFFIISCAYFWSCSASAPVSSWKNSGYKNISIKRLFDFAILKNPDDKREFEEKFDIGFSYESIDAHSQQEFPFFSIKPTVEELSGLISENNFDYLLTVKYLEKISDKANYANITYDIYVKKGMERINSSDYKEKIWDVNFEVILFSVKDKKPVWAGIFKTIDDIPMEAAIDLTIRAINNLYKEGIIKK